MSKKQYLCIDLKSFFASVECVERGLDPMKVNLVVADPDRTDKTICLAITPAMKALGIKNRCRIFEIPRGVEYIIAPPRMQKYIDYAANIYSVYIRYIDPADIHVYSIDEVFIDASDYLGVYGMTSKEIASMLMGAVLKETGVRAACGIGTNLYLSKVALDITAKHSAEFIGELDEQSYRDTLWEHRPLTDFWRIGHGVSRKLEEHGVYTMGGIARLPEEYLYNWFGIDAELLIDHAWGREPTTIADIKAYRSKTNCLSSGQVLMRDYTADEGEIIVREMMDQLCLQMASRGVVTNSITLLVGYSNALRMPFARGTASTAMLTNADSIMVPAVANLYRQTVDKKLPIRRVNITCNNILPEQTVKTQISFFDCAKTERRQVIQNTVLDIKRRFGKNSILKGINLDEAATGRERNRQIGGHKSG
ncbi:MAG: DNA repair protein [Clostridia bacterium]|nr:DNA repair protein [Clostridia bacterium]